MPKAATTAAAAALAAVLLTATPVGATALLTPAGATTPLTPAGATAPLTPAGATAPLTPAAAMTTLTPAGATAPLTHAGAAAPPTLTGCGPGELCLWGKAGFKGARHTYELADIDIESCVALPEGGSAESLANRTGRPVTAYQSAECAETAEFDTYPGGGTWAPESPYRVRAFKVWES